MTIQLCMHYVLYLQVLYTIEKNITCIFVISYHVKFYWNYLEEINQFRTTVLQQNVKNIRFCDLVLDSDIIY